MKKMIDLVILGDNLEVMKGMESESVDLCYIDPPFATGKVQKGKSGFMFDDNMKNEHYMNWIKSRIVEIHRILKQSGSFYLHCDWHADYQLRMLCDDIFGANNFKSHIIWKRHASIKNTNVKKYPVQTDSIFFFTKSQNYHFNMLYKPLDVHYKKSEYRHTDINGEYAFVRGRHSQETGQHKKKYLAECKGSPISTLWDDILPIITNQIENKEHSGYPTQKPIELLKRIITVSSKKGDIVFDPFCGAGTTLVAAKWLGRHYIGIDINPDAINIVKARLDSVITSESLVKQRNSRQNALF